MCCQVSIGSTDSDQSYVTTPITSLALILYASQGLRSTACQALVCHTLAHPIKDIAFLPLGCFLLPSYATFSLSFSSHFLKYNLFLPRRSLISKGQIQTATNYGREGMQEQRRNSQGTTVH